MVDPKDVPLEEKERTIRLGRQIFSNLIRQYFSPDQMRDLQQRLAELKQPRPAPQPAPQPSREVLAETIGGKPERPKIEVAETKVDTAGYFEECLHKFRR